MRADHETARRYLARAAAGGVAITIVLAGALAGRAAADPAPSGYTLSIVAGTGECGPPTPGPATSSSLGQPNAIARDAEGNVYVTDEQHSLVERISPSGVLSVFAGNGVLASSNDPTAPGPATTTPLGRPFGAAVGPDGDVYVADFTNGTIDKITPAGQLSIVAGVSGRSLTQTSPYGTIPAAGPATATVLGNPIGVAVDRFGSIYFSDSFNGTIGKVTAAGALTVIAGTGILNGEVLMPGPAISSLIGPHGLAIDSMGNLYVADDGNSDVEKITADGMLSIIAGQGPSGIENPRPPTPGPAVDSALFYPTGVAVDNLGNLYITDSLNFVVEKVTPDGVLSVIAGKAGLSGPATPGPALDSLFGTPSGVTVDPAGNVLISDLDCHVYKLTPPAPPVPSAPPAVPTQPSAPRDLQPTSGGSLHFAPPLSDGGSPITGYQFSTDGGATWQDATVTGSDPALIAAFPQLTAGRTYRLQLRAVNAIGTSPAATTLITPSAPVAPGKPVKPGTQAPAPATPKPWYVDPLTHTQRVHLPTVPTHPARSHGNARLTKAAYRTRNGTLAVALATARGHQLTAGQAVQVVNLFGFDSATLTTAGRNALHRLAASLHDTAAITCEGYADYAGKPVHERTLSTQRAAAVCAALRHDHPGLRTRTRSYGSTRPVVIGGTSAQRGVNRRVDILTRP